MSKIDELILDVRSFTHDTGTDNNKVTFAEPMETYMKALVKSDLVFRCRGHVQMHFSANPTIYFWVDCVQK